MENQELPKDAAELESLSVSKKMRAAEEMSKQVMKIALNAEKRANKLINKLGFTVVFRLDFHEVNKDEESR